MSLKFALLDILKNTEQPMTPLQIWPVLFERDPLIIKSKTPINSIIAFFSREINSKKTPFKKFKKGLYGLKDCYKHHSVEIEQPKEVIKPDVMEVVAELPNTTSEIIKETTLKEIVIEPPVLNQPESPTVLKIPTELEKYLYQSYIKKMITHGGIFENRCAICGLENGELVNCLFGSCAKMYHPSCVNGLMLHANWMCPLHFCALCPEYSGYVEKTCSICSNSYCSKHVKQGMIEHENKTICINCDAKK